MIKTLKTIVNGVRNIVKYAKVFEIITNTLDFLGKEIERVFPEVK